MKEHLKLATLLATKNNIFSIITLFALLLCGANSIFSQEWEVVQSDNDAVNRDLYDEVIELSNGNVLVSSRTQNVNEEGRFISVYPSLTLISSVGEVICSNTYFRPQLCVINSPYIFENKGEMYMLATYNPDHDLNSKNYFKNHDNPPTESIVGLYKLDELLNITKSYEHIFPIDTFEQKNGLWHSHPNIYSGNIYMYSAFEDDGHITGSYIKSVSYSNTPRGHDTIFFFKIDFDGNFLLRKGYEMHTTGGEHQTQYYRQQIVKNDDGYVVYYRGYSIHHHGTIEYYDKDFNHITTRYIDTPGHDPEMENNLYNHSVIRSKNNTTYLATTSLIPINPGDNWGGMHDRNIRLYEIDDNINNSTEVLPVIQYFERETSDLDDMPYRAVDMTRNEEIFFAYTLNYGSLGQGDSWVMIEKLDADFDTIATFYYDDGVDIHTEARCIKTTNDNGLLLVTNSQDLLTNDRWSKVSKIPASALTIEEAHAHNLKVAVAYPNPGGDVMNIRTSLRNCTLQVYDMRGRMVHKQEITDDVTSVDASSWSSGTYVWELGTENGSGILESGKWVK